MRSIESLQSDLEAVFSDDFHVVRRGRFGRVKSEESGRVQVTWAGIDPDDRTIWFAVEVIEEEKHLLGDRFLKAWELVLASDSFSGQIPDSVSYGEPPIGSSRAKDYVLFLVKSNECLEVLSGSG